MTVQQFVIKKMAFIKSVISPNKVNYYFFNTRVGNYCYISHSPA